MKELKVLSKELNKIGYKDLANSILKLAQSNTPPKPDKIIFSAKPSDGSGKYTLEITPIIGGKPDKAKIVSITDVPTPNGEKFLPQVKNAIGKLFAPNFQLGLGMVEFQLPGGKTPQEFGIVVKSSLGNKSIRKNATLVSLDEFYDIDVVLRKKFKRSFDEPAVKRLPREIGIDVAKGFTEQLVTKIASLVRDNLIFEISDPSLIDLPSEPLERELYQAIAKHSKHLANQYNVEINSAVTEVYNTALQLISDIEKYAINVIDI